MGMVGVALQTCIPRLIAYINIDINEIPAETDRVLRRFVERIARVPEVVRQEAGFQLYRVQRGLDPVDWKPMATIGRGVREIRIRDEAGIYRIIYIATFAEAVYVLHAFQKKTQRTAKRDVDLAASRLRDLVRGAR